MLAPLLRGHAQKVVREARPRFVRSEVRNVRRRRVVRPEELLLLVFAGDAQHQLLRQIHRPIDRTAAHGATFAVESHQPLPIHHAVSSDVSPRRNQRTSSVDRESSAAASARDCSPSRAPTHGMKAAGEKMRASYAAPCRRVTSSMHPRPSRSFGVSGITSRPPAAKRQPNGLTHLAVVPWRRTRRELVHVRRLPRRPAVEPQLVEGCVGGNPAEPGAEAPGWIEPGAASIGAPEGIHQDVLCRGRIPQDSYDPPVHLPVMAAVQRLERRLVPRHESGEQLRVDLVGHALSDLPVVRVKGSVLTRARARRKDGG
jgi:hypothetical protein